MDPTGHALVVGGSGMLAGLCLALARDGRPVTVVGRSRERLARLAAVEERVQPLAVDYEDVPAFAAALADAANARGPIVLAVCWIRSWAPGSLLAAAAAVAPGGTLVHVLGSSRRRRVGGGDRRARPPRRTPLPARSSSGRSAPARPAAGVLGLRRRRVARSSGRRPRRTDPGVVGGFARRFP